MTPLSRAGRYLGLPLRLTLLALLGVYRGTVGQLAGGRCRFHPTCSAYAIEAIHTHGAVRGLGMAVWRVLRCNPLFAGGLDPVTPPRRATSSYARGARGGRVEGSATASYKEAVTR